MNLKRRHLTTSQRAMIAEKLAVAAQGQRTDLSPFGEKLPRAEAAELLQVGTTSIDRARRIRREGAPELVAAVERGGLKVVPAVIAGCLGGALVALAGRPPTQR